MKRIFAVLVVTVLSGVAHADYALVSDQKEVLAINQAVSIAMGTIKQISCIQDGKKRDDVTVAAWTSTLESSIATYRSTSGQPVLQFVITSDEKSKTSILISTDASGKVITQLEYIGQVHTADTTVNVGTIANPDFRTVPGVWQQSSSLVCTVK